MAVESSVDFEATARLHTSSTMIASISGLLRRTNSHKQTLQSCTFRSLATSAQKRAAKRLAAAGKPISLHGQPGSHFKPSHRPENIPKAPHMDKDAIKKRGLIDYFKEAPFIPMVVIFPTVMMGVALIIRPDLRTQLWNGGKKSGDTKKGIPATPDSAKYADENTVLREIQKIENERQVGPGGSVDTVDAPKNLKPTQQAIPTIGTNGGKVAHDLIYAIGIRPHPSS
ncbi:hypothetical protein HJC23_000208 [Cyclotella cryptica]|uniref:Uncharacterized protein n=1 Tax=Cyclotella cryptica TaxID=29204 RepID=A0ABD3QD51_9STRA|eukprot:CCRYP_006403-RA/>CCRYP_006403-RA protein AED:0.21 eAED:0.21 QI:0/-1/0/1/-1/1/1/0/226